MVVCIDNYDSFTYNLVQMIQAAGFESRVFRNDSVGMEDIARCRPTALVISPGPGEPSSAGVSVAVVRHFSKRVPILGVCLGHQAIAEAFGGKICRAERVMHGKTSTILHDGGDLYKKVEAPFEAVRYHSLLVERTALPACLEVSAWTEEGEIMGIRHRHYRVEGVQFHPESIMTRQGNVILANFLNHRR
jgi:anthranilate synthase/aminodeoxychorismate synthase-like glutamine amidotransferase